MIRTPPSRPARSPGHVAPTSVRRWTVGLVVLAVAAAGTVDGCSDDDAVPPPAGPLTTSPTPTPEATPSAGAGEEQPAASADLEVTVDADGLSAQRTKAVAAAVGRVVGRWIDAAYLSGPVGTKPGARRFPGFTKGAAAAAARQADHTTNAALGRRAAGLAATARTLDAQVYVVGGRARGVVADLDLRAESGDATLTVTGTVQLTPTPEGWRIFGFDLRSRT